jgi:hypothetical protein
MVFLDRYKYLTGWMTTSIQITIFQDQHAFGEMFWGYPVEWLYSHLPRGQSSPVQRYSESTKSVSYCQQPHYVLVLSVDQTIKTMMATCACTHFSKQTKTSHEFLHLTINIVTIQGV